MKEIAKIDLDKNLPRKEEMDEEIKVLLIPKDTADAKNAVMEIRAGTGGDEASIFAGELYKMYSQAMKMVPGSSKQKELIKKTYFHLLLPQSFKISIKSLYRTVDQIWFLAGDNSTDFNFYSKRVILASIYINFIMHFINNDNIEETFILLDKQLKRVSKIPKIKDRINVMTNIIPQIFKRGKRFNFTTQ